MSDSAGAADRSRILYAVLTFAVLGLGLASRSSAAQNLPKFVSAYSGDTLWALMVFFLFAFVFRTSSSYRVAAYAGAFAAAIEVSQLFHFSWLEAIRSLPGMRLVFGYGFLWTDLLCYAVGILIGWAADTIICRRTGSGTADKR